MISPVWGGDHPVTQPWGCTSLIEEPYWYQAQCHWHCGVDIGMIVGMRLHAARAGRVAQVGYGLLIIDVAGSAEWDCYVHIDRACVAVGATVAAGDLVAYSGDKVPHGGYLTGPHLHFEVQNGGLNVPATSVDPIPVLTSLHGGAGGTTGGPDLLDDERKWLAAALKNTDAIYAAVTQGFTPQRIMQGLGIPPEGLVVPIAMQLAEISTIVAQLQTGPTPGVAGDNKPVLDAIAALHAALDTLAAKLAGVPADLGDVRMHVDKDLA